MAKEKSMEVLETLIIKLKSDNTFVIDKCKKELNKILKNEKAAISYSDRLTKKLPFFKENPAICTTNGEIFEIPRLSEKDKKRKKGNSPIYCYKDQKKGKNNNNVRSIFIMEEGKIVFLLAFDEKSKKDYRNALEESVNRYNKYLGGEYNE